MRENAAKLGVKYPIALDNDYGTWNAYGNQYWPAEYLIDAEGNIRHVEFGEGSYDRTESLIRRLLAEAKPSAKLGSNTKVADATPSGLQTPETYLGYERLVNRADQAIVRDQATAYERPDEIPANGFAYDGTWTVGSQFATAGSGARIDLEYEAAKVFLVLGGTGTVDVAVDGAHTKTVHVADAPTLYTLVDGKASTKALLTLRFSKGVQAYAFTFG